MPPCMQPPPASIAAIRSSARSACSRRPSSGSDQRIRLKGGGDAVVPSQSGTARKTPARAGVLTAERVRALLLEPDAGKLFLEPREPPAAIHQLLLTAGPSRMRLRVDVEVHGVAFLAPGAAGGEFGAVGHHHLDSVIVRMQVEFHGSSSCARRARVASIEKKSRLYSPGRAGKQAAAQVAVPAAIWRAAPDCYLSLAGALSRPLWPPFGRGCRGPVEMNVAERDAARAIGTAVEQPQSAAAGAA